MSLDVADVQASRTVEGFFFSFGQVWLTGIRAATPETSSCFHVSANKQRSVWCALRHLKADKWKLQEISALKQPCQECCRRIRLITTPTTSQACSRHAPQYHRRTRVRHLFTAPSHCALFRALLSFSARAVSTALIAICIVRLWPLCTCCRCA